MSARRSPPRATARLRRAPLTRSSSLLGTLKSIVAAPLAWFTSADDVHDTPGEKRPRRSQPAEKEGQQDAEGDVEHRSKRKRFHSPEPETLLPQPTQQYQPDRSAYLDPPQFLLSKKPSMSGNASSASSNHIRSFTAVPSTSARHQHRNRLSLSPRPSTAHGKPLGIARTQSMDPPSRLLAPPRATRPPPLSRDASMMSIDEPPSSPISPIGDVSMSPSRPRFKLRTSLTPQPSGSDFGPTPLRRARDPSEPPPLEALMENPIFVRGPPKPEPPQRQASLTLGSWAETHKSAQPLTRQRSNLTIAPQGSASDVPKNTFRPINAAELALHELEVYKTPLIPSRLRGSAALPDMFRPKRAAQRTAPPLLMNGDRHERPRLGLSDSEGAKKGDDGVKGKKAKGAGAKPYEGQGGMKKLLARRRMEEEEEREKEQEAAIVIDEGRTGDKEKVESQRKLAQDLESPLPVQVSEPILTIGGRPQSSLRVGRTRTARSHASAARPKSKNKFSAVYEDDDGDDAMSLGGDEAESSKGATSASTEAVLPPMYEAPKGFSFDPGSVKAAAPDVVKAKEPPIPVLPFSLTAKSAVTPAVVAQVVPVAQVTVPASSQDPLPSVPSIALIPPSPATVVKAQEKAAEMERTSDASGPNPSSIPNFFANSAIFNKPTAKLPFSLTAASSAPAASIGGFSWGPPAEKKAEGATSASSSFIPTPSTAQTATETLRPAFAGVPDADKAASLKPLFGLPATSEPAKELPTATSVKPSGDAPNSLFGGTPSTTVPSTPLFGGAPPTTASITPTFSFGVPLKPAENVSAPAPSPAPFSFVGSAKPADKSILAPAPAASPYPFGSAKVESKTETSDTPKPPSTSPSSPFPSSSSAPAPLFAAFGAQSSKSVASPPSVEPSKASFTFVQPASSVPSSTTATNAPTIEAPKPLFGSAPPSAAAPTPSFTFGASQSTPLPEAPAPAKSPFAFGTSTPSTPNPFGASPGAATPTTVAPPSLFGAPSSGSNKADVSKTFTFGVSTPVRHTTPPQRGDNEVNMDESPTRGAGMDLNGSESVPKPSLAGFGFSNNVSATSSPFGQTTQRGSSFGFGSGSTSSASNPFVKTETKPAEKPALTFPGFGQQSASTTSSSSPFAFGNTTSTQPPQPGTSSSGAFGFGPSASTPTSASSPFAFGHTNPSNSGLFGQPASAAAPTSPAFQSPSNPFGFGSSAVTPTSAPAQPFSFTGSQPASPATSSTGLPSAQSGGFSFGQSTGGSAGTPSPFGGNAPLPPTSGGSLFTMGSVPPPVAGGPRTIKKLPSRRGGKR